MPDTKPSGIISRQLRGMIEARGDSASALGRDAGIDPGVISRFIAGERDIRLETLDRLAAVLGLRLIEGARGKARPASKPARTAKPLRAPRLDGKGVTNSDPLGTRLVSTIHPPITVVEADDDQADGEPTDHHPAARIDPR